MEPESKMSIICLFIFRCTCENVTFHCKRCRIIQILP